MLPRHSELIRPAVANVDQALVIFAITKPQPNFNLLDRFLVMMQQQDIPCIICFNKQDIDEEGKRKIIVPLRTGGIPYDHGQRSQTRRDRYHSGAASRQDHYGGGSQRCR